MSLTMLGKKIAYTPAEPENKSQIYTGNKDPDPTRGTVTHVGPECEHVKVGDEIVLGKYSGNRMEIDGVTYIIVNEQEVLAVVDSQELI